MTRGDNIHIHWYINQINVFGIGHSPTNQKLSIYQSGTCYFAYHKKGSDNEGPIDQI